MPGKIFISYRRDDEPAFAARVRDGLTQHFGSGSVFMDVDELLAGQRFDQELAKALSACDVLIAVIGPRWMELLRQRQDAGERDYVREEIAEALRRKIVVIPVRVGRDGALAALPRQQDLPEDIAELVHYQKHDVTHERYGRDIAELTEAITTVREIRTPKVVLRLSWGAIGAVLLILAGGAVGYALYGTGASDRAQAPPAAPPPVTREAMIREAQGLLRDLGYDPGEVDGRRGVRTEDAVRAFQRDMGTSSRKLLGEVDEDLIGALRVAKRTKLRDEAQRQRQAEEKRVADLEKQRADEEAKRRTLEPGRSFKDCDTCPEMVVVPAGSFTMGSPSSEEGRGRNEGPQRKITIAKPFAVGKFEVTFGEYAAFVTATGHAGAEGCFFRSGNEWIRRSDKSWRDPGFTQTDRHPVACVSWEDAKAHVSWLSKNTGQTYRLLTEAEWEYAARAGATGAYSYGVADRRLGEFAWFSANSGNRTQPVGAKGPNAFGLHDVHGNLWEWVEDCYRDSYEAAPTDGSPVDVSDCGFRVVRGGSWGLAHKSLRSAVRNNTRPGSPSRYIGYRVARSL